MPVKLVCRKAYEERRIEDDIKELENEGYMVQDIIPISSDPKYADMCILLKKP